ncbi:sensor domain-containing diguanylate cyclase [bacterium]|nr:MAG: sensor domain-containing diguanylate cyclase [bacterium]
MFNMNKMANINGNAPTEGKRVVDLFLEMCTTLNSLNELDKIISFLVSELSEMFKANKVSFMLLDEAKGELCMKGSFGLNAQAAQAHVKLGEMFGGWVAQRGKPLLVKDVGEEFPYLTHDRLSRYSCKSFAIVPVQISEGIIGVLSVTEKKDGSVFSELDLEILDAVGRYLGLRIENMRLTERYTNISNIDILTGLYNHRYFQEQLSEEIYRAERYHRHLSLLMVDIDNFSGCNQQHGYGTGDKVLKEITRILKENVRKVDIISRFGPEEFMVILPETTAKDATFAGEKIRSKVEAAVFAESRTSSLGMFKLTASIGIAQHKLGLSSEELEKMALAALLEAKQKGKNCVCVFRKGEGID